MSRREPISIKILNNVVELEQPCWACGYGDRIDPGCEYCGGTGVELTNTGQAIIDLINNYIPYGKPTN